MSKKAKQPEIPIYLDVEWLLGDQPEPRHRPFKRRSAMPNVAGAMIGCCAMIAILYSWPHLSAAWLRSQWSNQLATASTDESLGLIMALGELGSLGTSSVVQQLNDADAEKRAVAFRALSGNIENAKSKADGSGQLLAIASELKSSNPESSESKLLHGKLAAMILDTASKSSSQYPSIESLCTPIIGSAQQGYSTSLTQVLIPKVPKPSDSLPTAVTRTSAPALPTAARLSDWTTETVPLPSVPAPVRGIPAASLEPTKAQTIKPKVVSAKISDASMQSETPVAVSTFPYSSVRLAPEALGNHSVSPTEPNNTSNVEVHGLDKIPLEQLFPMLGSTQDRRVNMVFDELIRRGVTEPIIKGAIDLARGSSQQRLTVLDEIVRSDEMNPLPLLVWMAQTNDRPVRQRAIAILGSMQDPEAMRRLRDLVHREPDQYLQQQIRQALVASGYANR